MISGLQEAEVAEDQVKAFGVLAPLVGLVSDEADPVVVNTGIHVEVENATIGRVTLHPVGRVTFEDGRNHQEIGLLRVGKLLANGLFEGVFARRHAADGQADIGIGIVLHGEDHTVLEFGDPPIIYHGDLETEGFRAVSAPGSKN